MISNSTEALPDPAKVTKEFARPTAVGLSAAESKPRYSFIALIAEGFFDEEYAKPEAISSVSEI